MPLSDPQRIEYAIDSGHITIVADDGKHVPAYWAHPRLHARFSSIGLFHDWWGVDGITRMLANFFAGAGYYVIVPDMFNGQVATTPQQAMELVKNTEESRYSVVNAVLAVLESHHMTNKTVAAVGLGMGGTLAFEAAIKRDDLEAAVSYAGFPQKYLGQFATSNTPILAVYGTQEPFVSKAVIKQLFAELKATELAEQHQLMLLHGGDHDLFHEYPNDDQRVIAQKAFNGTLAFLDKYLLPPPHIDKSNL
jgi:carboxymethylenebutenolidase